MALQTLDAVECLVKWRVASALERSGLENSLLEAGWSRERNGTGRLGVLAAADRA